jgi:hypothetical protein
MVFDDNDLIQANATIISGVLILLSLASISRTSSLPLLDRTMIASAIIPFYRLDYIATQSSTK